MSPKNKSPGRVGRSSGRDHQGNVRTLILAHPATTRNRDRSLPTVCRRTLVDLATARREYRDTVSPEMSDALDAAMESLRTALTIAELEGRENG